MKPLITAIDIQSMVKHWLGTGPYGYLGSPYGSDVKAMLLNPMTTGVQQSFVAKMREDIPIFRAPEVAAAVSIYTQDTYPDKREIIIDVGGLISTAQG